MNSFQLGGVGRLRRFINDFLKIQKSRMRIPRRQRPLLHFRVHFEFSFLVCFRSGRDPTLTFPSRKNKLVDGDGTEQRLLNASAKV